MKRISFFVALVLAGAPMLSPAAHAQTPQQQVVDQATAVVQSFKAINPSLRAYIKQARAIIVVPNMVKAGFIFGAQGGTGVLLVHNKKGWSRPAFYNMGAASFGFQAGIETSQVVLLLMTDRARDAMLQNAQVKLGAEAGLAVATIGAGAEAAVTTPGADVYAFSVSQGLFGGVAIDGGALGVNPDWDAAYYGQPLTAQQIVFQNRGRNPGQNELRGALRRF
jgi:SH3 domain-containing YSC84-like protein 1